MVYIQYGWVDPAQVPKTAVYAFETSVNTYWNGLNSADSTLNHNNIFTGRSGNNPDGSEVDGYGVYPLIAPWRITDPGSNGKPTGVADMGVAEYYNFPGGTNQVMIYITFGQLAGQPDYGIITLDVNDGNQTKFDNIQPYLNNIDWAPPNAGWSAGVVPNVWGYQQTNKTASCTGAAETEATFSLMWAKNSTGPSLGTPWNAFVLMTFAPGEFSGRLSAYGLWGGNSPFGIQAIESSTAQGYLGYYQAPTTTPKGTGTLIPMGPTAGLKPTPAPLPFYFPTSCPPASGGGAPCSAAVTNPPVPGGYPATPPGAGHHVLPNGGNGDGCPPAPASNNALFVPIVAGLASAVFVLLVLTIVFGALWQKKPKT